MNDFLRMSKQAILRHGVDITFKKVGSQSYDPNTGTVTSTDVTYSVKSYPKHITATQWSYPDLIGKDIIMFYLAGDNVFTPEVKDSIDWSGQIYKVITIQKHFAQGQVCLYRILSVRS